jgi:hypothetical protein
MMERKGRLERREKKGDGVCGAFHGSKGEEGQHRIKAHTGLSA